MTETGTPWHLSAAVDFDRGYDSLVSELAALVEVAREVVHTDIAGAGGSALVGSTTRLALFLAEHYPEVGS